MFATMRLAKMIALLAALGVLDSTVQAGPPAPPAAPVDRDTTPPAKTATDRVIEKVFPDGVDHDFGAVQHGTQLQHAFRIVNPFDRPLKILSLRST